MLKGLLSAGLPKSVRAHIPVILQLKNLHILGVFVQKSLHHCCHAGASLLPGRRRPSTVMITGTSLFPNSVLPPQFSEAHNCALGGV